MITGVAPANWAFSVGLEFALIRGILNFIPVIGSIAGIVPPARYTLIQYNGWLMPTAVFVGNFVYPMMQARGMAMPPSIIMLSLLSWSWLWGFAGAMLVARRRLPGHRVLAFRSDEKVRVHSDRGRP